MAQLPVSTEQKSASIFTHLLNGLTDLVLFVAILFFTAVAVVAVAIAAPLTLAVSAIIGRNRGHRTGWRSAKAG